MAESVLNICRICLQQIEKNVRFYFLNNENGLMLQSKLLAFLPEIALNATQNPIICNRCTITIDGIHEFKQLCLRTESIIKNLKMQQKPFEDVLNYVKKENTVHKTIKEELVEDTVIDELQIVDDDCLQVNMDLPVCIEASTKPLFYCYTCSYHTNSKTNLAQHIHNHRKDTVHETFKEELVEDTIINDELQIVDDDCLQLNTNLPLCIEAPTKPLFYCYTCNYNTNIKRNITRHVHTHRCTYKCGTCGYSCHIRSNLKTHLKRHSNIKNYKCGECDYSSAYKYGLKSHMIHMHNREELVKNYKCGECDYLSNYKHNLKSHVIHMHNREELVKSYKCGECDYSSNYKQNLKSHLSHLHTKNKIVKNHKCGECDYSTNYTTSLVTHIRSHTGEKPYKCNMCDFRCSHNSNLKVHLTTHTNEKSFKCKLCSYACNQRRRMKKHQQQHLNKVVISNIN